MSILLSAIAGVARWGVMAHDPSFPVSAVAIPLVLGREEAAPELATAKPETAR